MDDAASLEGRLQIAALPDDDGRWPNRGFRLLEQLLSGREEGLWTLPEAEDERDAEKESSHVSPLGPFSANATRHRNFSDRRNVLSAVTY